VQVEVTKRAVKSLRRVPRHIAVGFFVWKREVEEHGIETVRKIAGYHDEPLQGKLRRVRSVRLGLGYRVYYRIEKGRTQVLVVEEVNKHDYKAIERLLGR
jgi:mRNA-degrading endonuclease RelE of RelBE toxin-antitoxin system